MMWKRIKADIKLLVLGLLCYLVLKITVNRAEAGDPLARLYLIRFYLGGRKKGVF